LHSGETNVNKDQVNGVAKDIAGQVQEAAGKLVGNKDQEAKGLMKQVEGKTEKMYGDAKEVIKDAVNKA
ncbi:MAG: CsbD family protein, partial [Burkholderiaceae bacterium]